MRDPEGARFLFRMAKASRKHHVGLARSPRMPRTSWPTVTKEPHSMTTATTARVAAGASRVGF